MKKLIYSLAFILTLTFTFNIEHCEGQWVKLNFTLTEELLDIEYDGINIYLSTIDKGLYCSKDKGISWKAMNNGFPYRPTIFCLALYGTNIFAADNYQGVFLTSNNGENWNNIYNSKGITDLVISGTNIFASGVNGIFRSSNLGESWSKVSNAWIIGMEANNDKVFATTMEQGIITFDTSQAFHIPSYVMFSSDFGDNWSNLLYDDKGLKHYISKDKFCFLTNTENTYYSNDNCNSWTISDMDIVNSILISGTIVFISNSKKVFYSSDDGITWTGINQGLQDGLFITDLIIVDDILILTSLKNGIWKYPISDILKK
jgi:hypothetical protein